MNRVNFIRLLVAAFLSATFGYNAATAQYASHARALPYSGTWGVRILHATAYDINSAVNAENFDVDAFMAQIDQLTTINHVMINIGRGHQASWYSSPYPEMEAILGSSQFPERDLFGELADALIERDLKVLVYFSGVGVDKHYVPESVWTKWEKYLTTSGLTHSQAVAKILGYYAEKYGDKIDGWWFDRCGKYSMTNKNIDLFANAVRAGNPNAIIAFHGQLGSPLKQGSPYCDYTAGHPIPMIKQAPWESPNENMVKDIEAGPWIDQDGLPNTGSGTALGAIFMPFQKNWRNGKAGFPTAQAIEWTSRVMDAGGMYTWAVARVGNGFAEAQFQQLLEIDKAIKNRNLE